MNNLDVTTYLIGISTGNFILWSEITGNFWIGYSMGIIIFCAYMLVYKIHLGENVRGDYDG